MEEGLGTLYNVQLSVFLSAQSCNNGVGKLVYEKIADYKLSAGFGGGRQRVELVGTVTWRHTRTRNTFLRHLSFLSVNSYC